MGGVQLVCLGVVGEYVGRTYWESKKRPLYFVQEQFGLSSARSSQKLEDVESAASGR
jgi:hypothetical protein